MRKRAELIAHVQNTNSQYNLPAIGKKLAYEANRDGVAERFTDPSVQRRIEVDLALIDQYDKLLGDVEPSMTRTASSTTSTPLPLRPSPGSARSLPGAALRDP